MTPTVDNPILNAPYHEPARYWLYDAAGMPRVENWRRPAGYCFRARTRANERQLSMLSDEQFEELGVVNQIRQQVRAWRDTGYPGATPVTRQLLAHWTQAERERRLVVLGQSRAVVDGLQSLADGRCHRVFLGERGHLAYTESAFGANQTGFDPFEKRDIILVGYLTDEDSDDLVVRRELAAASIAALGDFWDNALDHEWQEFRPCPGKIS